jgi:hypothetical protein
VRQYAWDSMTGEDQTFLGAIALRVDRQEGFQELARIEHPFAVDEWCAYNRMVRRSLVIDPVLYTLSDLGFLGSSLADFADAAWVPFPTACKDWGGDGGGGRPGGDDGGSVPPSPGDDDGGGTSTTSGGDPMEPPPDGGTDSATTSDEPDASSG